MTPLAIQRAIDVFMSSWTTTSIQYVSLPEPALPFIAHNVILGDMIGLEIQGAAERVGVIFIDIFTAKNAGDLAGYTHGGNLEAMFWHKNSGNLYFENGDLMPSTHKIGVDESRNAFHYQTQIPLSIITEY